MDVRNNNDEHGQVKIATTVIEKVAKFAASDIEGVKAVSVGSMGFKGLFAKTNLPKAVNINLYDGVAEVTIYIIARYGYKIPIVCREVQRAVKTEIQNAADITVSKVNVIVAGVEVDGRE